MTLSAVYMTARERNAHRLVKNTFIVVQVFLLLACILIAISQGTQSIFQSFDETVMGPGSIQQGNTSITQPAPVVRHQTLSIGYWQTCDEANKCFDINLYCNAYQDYLNTLVNGSVPNALFTQQTQLEAEFAQNQASLCPRIQSARVINGLALAFGLIAGVCFILSRPLEGASAAYHIGVIGSVMTSIFLIICVALAIATKGTLETLSWDAQQLKSYLYPQGAAFITTTYGFSWTFWVIVSSAIAALLTMSCLLYLSWYLYKYHKEHRADLQAANDGLWLESDTVKEVELVAPYVDSSPDMSGPEEGENLPQRKPSYKRGDERQINVLYHSYHAGEFDQQETPEIKAVGGMNTQELYTPSVNQVKDEIEQQSAMVVAEPKVEEKESILFQPDEDDVPIIIPYLDARSKVQATAPKVGVKMDPGDALPVHNRISTFLADRPIFAQNPNEIEPSWDGSDVAGSSVAAPVFMDDKNEVLRIQDVLQTLDSRTPELCILNGTSDLAMLGEDTPVSQLYEYDYSPSPKFQETHSHEDEGDSSILGRVINSLENAQNLPTPAKEVPIATNESLDGATPSRPPVFIPSPRIPPSPSLSNISTPEQNTAGSTSSASIRSAMKSSDERNQKRFKLKPFVRFTDPSASEQQ